VFHLDILCCFKLAVTVAYQVAELLSSSIAENMPGKQ
jgi:hypothetical protein